MEITKKKRTREEARAAFKDFLLRKKVYEEEAIVRLETLKLQGFFSN